ncbi:MAG: 1-acyl-sn-glycerol-3-phosphate acyltransferase [Victivallales bacterium]
MQNIIIEKPYKFIPPKHYSLVARITALFVPQIIRKKHGIESTDVVGLEKLRESIRAGHGIIIAPNHSRPSDPEVIGMIPHLLAKPVYIMASWHLFMQSRVLGWMLPRVGAFSMYREGLDREAIKCAIQILVNAKRPLIIFPEGLVSRTNDRLNNLMDGTAFMARNAAKQRAAMPTPGKVVIHPVAIRYFFRGDIVKALNPTLEEIEKRLSWRPQTELSMIDRIRKIGDALVTLKEIEYLGKPQNGTLGERTRLLIDRILEPIEKEWPKGRQEDNVTARVKALRTEILPDMVSGEIDEKERSRRWKQLADLYLAQQLFFYPPDYFSDPPTAEQMLETVERYEEDLTDVARIYRPIHMSMQIGDAIEVSPVRDRTAETDPVMQKLRSELERMLAEMKKKT